MIPLKDLNPRRSFPYITLLLIAVNVAVFAYQLTLSQAAGEVFIKAYGLVPSKVELALDGHRYSLAQALWPFFTSMFLHGGYMHIIGNMWFLWIFGDNIEDRLGPSAYLLFYLVCGIGSGLTQVVFSWGSHIPAIGASGAISGVLGAYLLYFPRARILTLIPLLVFWFTARIPAMVFIGLWFVLQFLSGLGSLGAINTGGVAWWAHVGGFLLGMLFAGVVKLSGRAANSG